MLAGHDLRSTKVQQLHRLVLQPQVEIIPGVLAELGPGVVAVFVTIAGNGGRECGGWLRLETGGGSPPAVSLIRAGRPLHTYAAWRLNLRLQL
jgi:hypothetical protein